MENLLSNRFKSFGWRLAAYLIAATLAWSVDNIGLLELNPTITAIVGLLLGEASKWFANYQKQLGRSYLGRKL